MRKAAVSTIFLALGAIGLMGLTGILGAGAMMSAVMSWMTGGVLLGIIVLLELVAVFLIFD